MLLWVSSGKIGSRLIRWGLESDCSHFAVCFDEDAAGRGIVFHSSAAGTQMVWLRDFIDSHTVVHALEPRVPLSLEGEEGVYKAILSTEAGLDYDWAALGWWAWRALLHKTTRYAIGSSNQWQSRSKRLCTGIAPAAYRALGVPQPPNIDFEMIAPHRLHEIALASGSFITAQIPWSLR